MSARTQDSGSCKKYGEMLFLKKWKSEYFTVQPLILKKKKKKMLNTFLSSFKDLMFMLEIIFSNLFKLTN